MLYERVMDADILVPCGQALRHERALQPSAPSLHDPTPGRRRMNRGGPRRALILGSGLGRAGERFHQSQLLVHDVEPHASGRDAPTRGRHSSTRQPAHRVGRGLSPGRRGVWGALNMAWWVAHTRAGATYSFERSVDESTLSDGVEPPPITPERIIRCYMQAGSSPPLARPTVSSLAKLHVRRVCTGIATAGAKRGEHIRYSVRGQSGSLRRPIAWHCERSEPGRLTSGFVQLGRRSAIGFSTRFSTSPPVPPRRTRPPRPGPG